jgi:anti-sigma regulatory factor (Ser/Thr protein kinase)
VGIGRVVSSRGVHDGFVAEPYAVGAARRACGEIADALEPGARRRLALVVSELVSNGVRHGSARSTDPVAIDVSLSGTVVRVEVTDAGGGFEPPPPPRRGTLASGGWGLVVVDALADRWGVSTASRRSRVWAELELDGAGAAETAHR